MTKILLMGNPNVGKSAVFSRLTGVRAVVSNYPGTTVSYTRGQMKLGMWQQVFHLECDVKPRDRSVIVTVNGA